VDFVLQAFAQFREEVVASRGGRTATKPRGTADTGDATVSGTTDEPSPDPHAAFAKGQPLPVFLKEKNPKSNDSAVAVMAVWANANEGTIEFTHDVIEKLWSKSARKKAGNLSRDINNAAKNGWLDKAARGKYSLPSYGIDYVRGLPAKPKE